MMRLTSSLVLLGFLGAAMGASSFLVNSGCKFRPLEIFSKSASRVDGSNCGTLFKKSEWANAPQVAFPDAKDDKLYLLLMLDADAPDHLKEGKFWFHWAVANIKGNQLKSKSDLSTGATLLSYRQPNPPKNSGQHRYIFVLYEQDSKEPITESVTEPRSKFDLAKWIGKTSKLRPLTGPIATSQFKVEYSE